MNALTLQWYDAGQEKTQKIYEQQPSKNYGTVRIGRDPLRCDIVLSNPTVSGLHIEIFFHPQQQHFFIRNLRESNPPLVNGQQLFQGELVLIEGSTLYLGQQELKVTAVSIASTSGVPATVLFPPIHGVSQPATPVLPRQPHANQVNQGHHFHPPTPPVRQQPVAAQGYHHHSRTPSVQQGAYGLQCPKCRKVSSVEHLQVGCPWCGTSLAAAVSVLVPPS